MKLLRILRTLGILLVLLGAQAHAAVINITPAYTPQWTSNDTSNLSATQVSGIVGVTVDELYKMDVGAATDTGPAATWYSTTFANTPTDPQDATITWGGGSFIVCPECFLLVKDGAQVPAQYIFDIGTWDGQDTLQLSGFWPQQGAISHIAIYGAQPVPAPATLALLGLGVLGLGLARRRKQ